jgi:hypothetical protein
MRRDTIWLEVWIDDAPGSEYLLLLRANRSGPLQLIDPQEAGKVIAEFAEYPEAVHWLNEDEYDLVQGRVFLANGGELPSSET